MLEKELKFPKYLKSRVCRDCGKKLTKKNTYPSCLKRHQRVCKHCWNERFYVAVRVYKYGMTKEGVVELARSQENKCAICKENLTSRFHIDHSHRTGRARGILCNNCNLGISLLRDSVTLLEQAKDYLLKHEEETC